MKKVTRQSLSNRLVHAVTAISIFTLFFTGFGQMPVYKRYMLNEVPGFSWTADYMTTLWWHYFFGVILIAVSFYHLAYHIMRKEYDAWPKKGDLKASWVLIKAMITKKEEPQSEKYLPEQRLGYAFIAFWIGVMIITGIIKAIKSINGVDLSLEVLFWTAQIHNLGFFMLIVGVAGHLSAFLFKANRYLLPGMLWGKVDACYVKLRHGLWKKGIKEANETISKHEDPENACKDFHH
ncbi:MAG: cytochrome b/b6 domain-containing protein [Campylobacteraceae bacterium]|nr:cytochrome b/b6 domain-containing protein [Campylobacteraceae bacterium]